jgi:tungstate transport system substrate-binding protein
MNVHRHLRGLAAALGLAAATGGAAAQEPAGGRREVILATTSSFYDTGLLDSLGPLFTRRTGYALRTVAVGSGQALRMGERGDADVILAHSPEAEAAFIAGGHGRRRLVVAWNYFTIAGPPADPAGVRHAATAAEALAIVARAGAVFVSRGDSSGTHQRELALWRDAGGRPNWPGYLETGQGMSASLLVADERRGYTLADRATLGALRHRVDLVALRGAEPALLNVYHVIEVSAAGRPRVNAEAARAFAEFVTSAEVQDLIASYGIARFGEPWFVAARGREPSP